MTYERFKDIFLTYGICEIEFSFKTNNKRIIKIRNYASDNNRFISVDNKKIEFNNCEDLFTLPIINSLTLSQLWNEIQIDVIDEMISEHYEQWYNSIEHLTLNYFNEYQIKKTITKEELLNKIQEDEYNGKLLLLAGTQELKDIDINNFKIIIYVPEIYRFYTLESHNGQILINLLVSFIEEIKSRINKNKKYSCGRLLTRYNDKNKKIKSEKYNELLKYVKSQNSLLLGGVLFSIIIIVFCFLLYTITLIKQQPLLFIIAIISFILSWVLIFKIGKIKKKKEKEFEDKYFIDIYPNKINQGEMNPVILEKYGTSFNTLITRLKQKVSNITISGLYFEDNNIDLQIEKNPKGLYFNFGPQILCIFDEEDNTYYFRYDKYTYEELEDLLIDFVINHFNK